MIHLTNVTRQHGTNILFQNASVQITPGSRSGLVGPNGAGKSTIFRLITGEENLDGGEISCSKKTVIGYFSQDVGEMAGRSALAEVMSASARTMQLGEEIKTMEAAMCEPMADDALADLLDYRAGHFQGTMVTVLGAMHAERTDRGDEMFMAMISRSSQAIVDLDSFSVI